ncbi:hypothetical protein BJ742DRAFT_831453 [Cladochytrium replicatum]|nr:hypothetical protein BJ742DRAFT_831453 [Cladochytrium replicatum]
MSATVEQTASVASSSASVHEEVLPESQAHVGRVIAIAIDSSPHSEYAFKYVLEQIANAKDQICLLHCRPLPQVNSTFSGPYTDVSEWIERIETDGRADSHALLKRYGAQVLKGGFAVRAIALRGDPRDEIVAKVAELSPMCLVLGSRGMGSFKRALIGSVSDHCVHHAPCPVLVVREQ